MTDWADEIADKLCAAGEYIGQTKAVADTLRKVREEGKLEGARYVTGLPKLGSIEAGKAYIENKNDHIEILETQIDRELFKPILEPVSEQPSEQNSAVRNEASDSK